MTKNKVTMEVSSIPFDVCVSENCFTTLREIMSEDLGRDLTDGEFDSIAPVAVLSYGSVREEFNDPFWGSVDLSIASKLDIFNLQDIKGGISTGEYEEPLMGLLGYYKDLPVSCYENAVTSNWTLIPSSIAKDNFGDSYPKAILVEFTTDKDRELENPIYKLIFQVMKEFQGDSVRFIDNGPKIIIVTSIEPDEMKAKLSVVNELVTEYNKEKKEGK